MTLHRRIESMALAAVARSAAGPGAGSAAAWIVLSVALAIWPAMARADEPVSLTSLKPVQEAFNAASARTRLILIVSPT